MPISYKIILFVPATIGIVWVSWPSLRDFRHHGFYRFLSWETILILLLLNMDVWFVDPFGIRQIFAWVFLMVSLFLIIGGVLLFRRKGNIDQNRSDPALVGVEKTTELVTTGLYRYIRHPFYSSLLFLGWGIFLKQVTWMGIVLAVLNTGFLIITARVEEGENIRYFGQQYREYMKQTRMFIPFVL